MAQSCTWVVTQWHGSQVFELSSSHEKFINVALRMSTIGPSILNFEYNICYYTKKMLYLLKKKKNLISYIH